jgi:hypothetical protein
VKCLRTVGKAATKYFLAHEKNTEKCLDLRRSGKSTETCPTAKTTDKIQSALDKASESITKACPALPPSYWSFCPVDATAACDDSIGSVAQLAACVGSSMTELSMTLVCEQYPDAESDGVTCPQTCMAASFFDTCDGTDDDCDVASADGSEDPLLGSTCDGGDTDLCQEGTRSCSSGALQCSDTTGNAVETCNLADDDCDGATDENYPENTNPMCPAATFLGAISGDEGSDGVMSTETDERWYAVQVLDSSPFFGDYLSATVSLQSPPSEDFDLYVYCYNCGGTAAGSSEASAGELDTVSVARTDAGSDDGFTLLIEVRHFSGHSCSDWTLQVVGNTTFSGAPTCN